MERRYLSQAGDTVRIKLVHVEELETDVSLDDSELAVFPGLRDALLECKRKSSVKRYPESFEYLNPVPTVYEMEAGHALRFVELLMSKTGRSPYETPVRASTSLGKYIMAVEHHCG
jgi:hypothetical protein